MMVNRIASIGLVAALAFAPLTAIAQASQPAANSATAMSRTGAGAGSNAARTRHRGTRTRQRARSTAEHARRAGAVPPQ
jgi:hypothetical protein